MAKRGRKAITQVLADLSSAPHPALDDLRALSDLSGNQLDEFKQAWPSIAADKRLEIMKQLGEQSEDSFDLNINAVSRVALQDADDQVRAAAIRNLWEDEGRDLVDPFLNFLLRDDSEAVRIAAATALGMYVYLGEMEEIPEELTERIEDALFEIFEGDDTLEVRRRALESIGFSQRPEAVEAISRAYEDSDELMRVSSLFAMGRNLDPDKWGDIVLANLEHTSPQVRFEAARAAGEMQLEDAIPTLGELLNDPDPEVQDISAWSLGEIGGGEAHDLLEQRLETAEGDLAQTIEDAMNNAQLMDDVMDFGMLEASDDDEDEQARKARLN